jgi:hypothetical protein
MAITVNKHLEGEIKDMRDYEFTKELGNAGAFGTVEIPEPDDE